VNSSPAEMALGPRPACLLNKVAAAGPAAGRSFSGARPAVYGAAGAGSCHKAKGCLIPPRKTRPEPGSAAGLATKGAGAGGLAETDADRDNAIATASAGT
jgi:hypothetical protein